MKKTLKIIFKTAFIFSLIFFVGAVGAFFIIYETGDKVLFDENKFYENVSKINFYDNENRIIDDNNSYNVEFIKLENLKDYTKQAFISIEDKEFYKHKGLNYKRILKALILDLKNRNMAQGASTISQQLIKNTHLSSQKTISRKINEIILTKKLERSLSKNQILENYLNIIYFGDNCYGIEKASLHYFSKSAKDLTLEESALLAGIITSPASNSPVTNQQRATYRRNVVLKEMFEDKKITNEEYDNAINKPISLNVDTTEENTLNTYTESALDEAIQILKLPAKQISLGDYKIYTYYNKEKQEKLMETSNTTNFENNNYSILSMTNDGKIEAFTGSGNYKTLQIKRQPASTIKPILVYGPALNENLISPISQILDEEISISGYTPQNHDLQLHGYLSVRDAVSKSYNIPAVKIMSYLGVEKAKKYAQKAGISFDEKDNNYAIALGGMTYGTTLKELTGAYTSFANNGLFNEPTFISYITDKNDNIVYVNQQKQVEIFRQDSTYLMNEILMSACKNGTSKGLASLPFQVASKTGTNGKYQDNYDAFAVSYTTKDIFGVWIGNFDNSTIGKIVGGTTPIQITKKYFESIYEDEKPKNFEIPNDIIQTEIDLIELKENHQIVLASDFLPDEQKTTEIFSTLNPPKQSEEKLISLKPSNLDGKVENGYAILNFDAVSFAEYELYMNDKLIETFSSKKGKVTYKIELASFQKNSFVLKTKLINYKNNQEIVEESNKIELMKTKNTENNFNRIKTKWYL